jgi:hypothetical protein
VLRCLGQGRVPTLVFLFRRISDFMVIVEVTTPVAAFLFLSGEIEHPSAEGDFPVFSLGDRCLEPGRELRQVELTRRCESGGQSYASMGISLITCWFTQV